MILLGSGSFLHHHRPENVSFLMVVLKLQNLKYWRTSSNRIKTVYFYTHKDAKIGVLWYTKSLISAKIITIGELNNGGEIQITTSHTLFKTSETLESNLKKKNFITRAYCSLYSWPE